MSEVVNTPEMSMDATPQLAEVEARQNVSEAQYASDEEEPAGEEVVNTPEKCTDAPMEGSEADVVNTPEKCTDATMAGSEAETEVTPEKSVKAESRAEQVSSVPKRAVVPFFQYMNANRSRLMEEFGLKLTEVPKKAKELFDALPAEERQVFDQKYQEQKKVYEAYMASEEGQKLVEERKKQKELEKKAEEKKKLIRKRAAAKKAQSVKRPPTPVEQFLEERKAQIYEDVKKGDVNDANTKVPRNFQVAAEAKKRAQELFDALPAAERTVYETRHAKQMKAFESLKEAEKKALQEYKASVRQSIVVPKEPKAPKERKREREPKAPKEPRAPKKAKKSEEPEVMVSPNVAAKAAEMGLAESGVSYVSLLEKLLRTPGLQGNVSDDNALTVLKKNGGNLNLSRNEIKGGA